MKNKIRRIIKEEIEKIYSADDETFEISDLEHMESGKRAHKQFMDDFKEDKDMTEPYVEPNEKEMAKLYKALFGKDSKENIKDTEKYKEYLKNKNE